MVAECERCGRNMALHDCLCDDPEPRTAPKMTEAQIQHGLRDALERLGFSVYSTRFSIRSDPGFPDIVAVRDRDGALVAIECKGPTGKVRPGQSEWIERFAQVSGCVFAEIVGPVTSDQWVGYDVALWQLQNAIEEVQP